jgi:hypothetical protein
MGWAESGMRSEKLVKLREQVVSESNNFFIIRQRHGEVSVSGGCFEYGAVIVKINDCREGMR